MIGVLTSTRLHVRKSVDVTSRCKVYSTALKRQLSCVELYDMNYDISDTPSAVQYGASLHMAMTVTVLLFTRLNHDCYLMYILLHTGRS
jgi:hypothetical protein